MHILISPYLKINQNFTATSSVKRTPQLLPQVMGGGYYDTMMVVASWCAVLPWRLGCTITSISSMWYKQHKAKLSRYSRLPPTNSI